VRPALLFNEAGLSALFVRVPFYLLLPILNILVPQVGQVPVVAGLLFFIVIALGAFISFLVLHLTQ
jgi:hypothetical protein